MIEEVEEDGGGGGAQRRERERRGLDGRGWSSGVKRSSSSLSRVTHERDLQQQQDSRESILISMPTMMSMGRSNVSAGAAAAAPPARSTFVLADAKRFRSAPVSHKRIRRTNEGDSVAAEDNHDGDNDDDERNVAAAASDPAASILAAGLRAASHPPLFDHHTSASKRGRFAAPDRASPVAARSGSSSIAAAASAPIHHHTPDENADMRDADAAFAHAYAPLADANVANATDVATALFRRALVVGQRARRSRAARLLYRQARRAALSSLTLHTAHMRERDVSRQAGDRRRRRQHPTYHPSRPRHVRPSRRRQHIIPVAPDTSYASAASTSPPSPPPSHDPDANTASATTGSTTSAGERAFTASSSSSSHDSCAGSSSPSLTAGSPSATATSTSTSTSSPSSSSSSERSLADRVRQRVEELDAREAALARERELCDRMSSSIEQRVQQRCSSKTNAQLIVEFCPELYDEVVKLLPSCSGSSESSPKAGAAQAQQQQQQQPHRPSSSSSFRSQLRTMQPSGLGWTAQPLTRDDHRRCSPTASTATANHQARTTTSSSSSSSSAVPSLAALDESDPHVRTALRKLFRRALAKFHPDKCHAAAAAAAAAATASTATFSTIPAPPAAATAPATPATPAAVAGDADLAGAVPALLAHRVEARVIFQRLHDAYANL